MSKTHKITQLKKRIAELEKKPNRREDIGSNPVRCLVVEKEQPIVIKTERHLSLNSHEHYLNNASYQESIGRMLVLDLADVPEFAHIARTAVKVDDNDPDLVRIRAAIQVLPYFGDMWEDNK